MMLKFVFITLVGSIVFVMTYYLAKSDEEIEKVRMSFMTKGGAIL